MNEMIPCENSSEPVLISSDEDEPPVKRKKGKRKSTSNDINSATIYTIDSSSDEESGSIEGSNISKLNPIKSSSTIVRNGVKNKENEKIQPFLPSNAIPTSVITTTIQPTVQTAYQPLINKCLTTHKIDAHAKRLLSKQKATNKQKLLGTINLIDEDELETDDENSTISKGSTSHLSAQIVDETSHLATIKESSPASLKTGATSIQATSSKENSSEENLSTKKIEKQKNVKNDEELDLEVSQDLLYFIDLVYNALKSNKEHRNEVMKSRKALLKNYRNANRKVIESKEFEERVKEATQKVKLKPEEAMLHFVDVYFEVKNAVVEKPVRRQVRNYLNKLKERYRLLHIKIKKLEATEVDLNDETDNTYEQMQRYRQKIVAVHKKICELEKKDPHEGRLIYKSIDFHGSKYVELNKAINKTLKNNGNFVNLDSFQKLIKKYFNDNNITVLNNPILFNAEVKRCFEMVGEKQQRRRKADLYSIQQSYLPIEDEDPYDKDESLREMLDQNKKKCDNAIADIINRFAEQEELQQKMQPTTENLENSVTTDSNTKTDVNKSDCPL